jgi:hypothetical protein
MNISPKKLIVSRSETPQDLDIFAHGFNGRRDSCPLLQRATHCQCPTGTLARREPPWSIDIAEMIGWRE